MKGKLTARLQPEEKLPDVSMNFNRLDTKLVWKRLYALASAVLILGGCIGFLSWLELNVEGELSGVSQTYDSKLPDCSAECAKFWDP